MGTVAGTWVLIDCPGHCPEPCEHRFTYADLVRAAQARCPERPQALVDAYLAGRAGFGLLPTGKRRPR